MPLTLNEGRRDEDEMLLSHLIPQTKEEARSMLSGKDRSEVKMPRTAHAAGGRKTNYAVCCRQQIARCACLLACGDLTHATQEQPDSEKAKWNIPYKLVLTYIVYS